MTGKDTVDRLVAEVAAQASADLLAEATALASERVRDELTTRLEHAMLAAVASTAPASEPDRPVAGDGETGLYGYGIVGDGDLDLSTVTGVETGASPRVVRHNGVGLIVSDVRLAELAGLDAGEEADANRLAEFARRHDAVVRATFEQTAVLPLRFGTVLADTRAATTLLDERRGDALALLERVAGNREWGAKVMPAAEETAEAPSAGAKPRSGTEFLAHKRDELEARRDAATRRAEQADGVHTSLAGTATDSRHRSAANGEVLLDGAYLVPAAQTDEFLTRARSLADELAASGLRLRLSGPWPPYSFAAFEERARV